MNEIKCVKPDSLGLTSGLDHSEGLFPTPVPQMHLIVGGNEQQLSRGVKSKRCDCGVTLCKPALTATLEHKNDLYFGAKLSCSGKSTEKY